MIQSFLLYCDSVVTLDPLRPNLGLYHQSNTNHLQACQYLSQVHISTCNRTRSKNVKIYRVCGMQNSKCCGARAQQIHNCFVSAHDLNPKPDEPTPVGPFSDEEADAMDAASDGHGGVLEANSVVPV